MKSKAGQQSRRSDCSTSNRLRPITRKSQAHRSSEMDVNKTSIKWKLFFSHSPPIHFNNKRRLKSWRWKNNNEFRTEHVHSYAKWKRVLLLPTVCCRCWLCCYVSSSRLRLTSEIYMPEVHKPDSNTSQIVNFEKCAFRT